MRKKTLRKRVSIGYESTFSPMLPVSTSLRIELSPPIHGGWQLARCKGLLLGGCWTCTRALHSDIRSKPFPGKAKVSSAFLTQSYMRLYYKNLVWSWHYRKNVWTCQGMQLWNCICESTGGGERDTDVDLNEVAPRLLKSRLAVSSYDKSFCNAWELYLDENPIFIRGAWLLAGSS